MQWTIGELASKAQVTVRTLRHYHQLDLLSPSHFSEAGYRLYNLQDLQRLQQILALKTLGLSLQRIREIMQDPGFELKQALAQQKQALQSKIQEWQQALEILEQVDLQADSLAEVDSQQQAQQLFDLIALIQMAQSQDWIQSYYTSDQLAELKSRAPSAAAQQKITQAWQQLYADVRLHLHAELLSPEVQQLVQRWQALIAGFTNGRTDHAASLKRLHNDSEAPIAFQNWKQQWAAEADFIQRALAAQLESR